MSKGNPNHYSISEIEQLLKSIYLNPEHKGSFSSAFILTKILRNDHDIQVPVSLVQRWLNKQRVHYLNKPARQTFSRNPTIAVYIDQQWQADLMFLPELAEFNDNFSCFLAVIDIISRFSWVQPLRNKTGAECTKLFDKILKIAAPRKPIKLQTDDGKEFFNKNFKKLMSEYDIIHFSTKSDMKAAVVERFNKTLKEKIYKFLSIKPGNSRFIDELQALVTSYNNTFHSSLGRAPSEVTNCTLGKVVWNLYGHLWSKNRKEKTDPFAVGDVVRISSRKYPFSKRYKGNWTEEIFKIYQVKQALPQKIYKIADLNGEKIEGSFYREELQKAEHLANQYWVVEELLEKRSVWKQVAGKKKRVTEFLVKWYGYPNSFNSWVPENEVQKKMQKM